MVIEEKVDCQVCIFVLSHKNFIICAILTNIWFIVKSLYPPSGAPGAAGRQGPPGEKGAKGSEGKSSVGTHTNLRCLAFCYFIIRTGREQTC